MDYVTQWDYANYLIEMDNLDRHMSRSIQEALILSEGVDVVDRFDVLQEGIVDSIKNAWNGLVRTIKNLFAKMINGINSKFADVQKYLTDYKEFILNRPYKLEGVRMKNYQPKRIVAVHLEQFQFDNMKQMADDTAYMKHYINTYNGDGKDVGTWAKAYFCGGSEDLTDVTTLNMTDLYNFCMDWENKTKKELTNDQSVVIKSADAVRNLIAQAEINAKNEQIAKDQAEKEKQSQTVGQPNKPDQQTVQDTEGKDGEIKDESALGASFRYSDLYNGIISISEAEIPPQKSSSSSSGGSGSGTAPTTPSAAAGKFSSNVGGVNGKAETQDTATAAYNNGKTYEEVQKAVDIYKNVTGGIAAAKITVCEDMFNDYFAIIKAHVKMYVGDDKAEKTQTQVATDYRALGLPDPESQKPGTKMKGNDGILYMVASSVGKLVWTVANFVRGGKDNK